MTWLRKQETRCLALSFALVANVIDQLKQVKFFNVKAVRYGGAQSALSR